MKWPPASIVILGLPLLVLIVTSGCEKEPKYGGKSRSAWIEQTEDKQAEARAVAYKALSEMRGDHAAAECLKSRLKDDHTNGMVAAAALLKVDHDVASVLPAVKRQIDLRMQNPVLIDYFPDELQVVLAMLGADAKPLLPDLKAWLLKAQGSKDAIPENVGRLKEAISLITGA